MTSLVVRSGAPGRPVEFDERWQEVWLRRCRGEPFTQIAATMGVSRHSVKAWYDKYAALEVARSEDPERERAFLIGRFENLALKSIEAYDTSLSEVDVDWKSDPRPAHMANAIKALQMVAKLSGFDVRPSNLHLHRHEGGSEIVIKVGGKEMVRRRVGQEEGQVGAIEVASREMVEGGGTGGGAVDPPAGEVSGGC